MPCVPNLRFQVLQAPEEQLQVLKNAIKNRILRKAVRAGAKPARIAAKANAPKDSKSLKSSITVKIGTSKRTGMTYAVIGPRRGFSDIDAKKKPTKYSHFVEFGTRPHSLSKGARLERRTTKGLSGFVDTTGDGNHGVKATHFLEKSGRSTSQASLDAMLSVIALEIDILLNKPIKAKATK